jgi:DNA-directed RNA polymerase specialized sigma24 family protein
MGLLSNPAVSWSAPSGADVSEAPELARHTLGPKRTFPRLPKADVEALVAAFHAGAGIRELAGRFGIGRSTVQNHLDRAGVDRSRKPALDEQGTARAVDLREKGWSYQRIATELEVSAGTVRSRLISSL